MPMFDPAFPQPIALTSSECLKLINLKPTTDVEIHLLVEGCESRLAEDEVADLLQLVANLLGDEVDVCFMYNHKLRETQELHWLSLACARPEIFFVFNFKVFSRIIVNNLNSIYLIVIAFQTLNVEIFISPRS